MSGGIVVETSSRADPGFLGEWYPTGLPAWDRLVACAERSEAAQVTQEPPLR